MYQNNILKTKGGKRKGAGRKLAPYKTTTIAFRVRIDWISELKSLINNRIKELKLKEMKTYSLIKTKDGERKGTEISHFIGENENDPKMLDEVKTYLTEWLNSYTSISDEEISDLFSAFAGSFSYDVWIFELIENDN